MGKIKQMSSALANQIAAGEVVERPASVVKELVENAIDANSRQVQIEVIEAGIQQIKVIDDGSGMSQEDLNMAFKEHATSKIYTVHDLFNISSLGFRGEALASIASVSKIRLESTLNPSQNENTLNEEVSHSEEPLVGHFVRVEGTELIEKGKTAPRPGTIVEVNSLFYNTPARLKHLASIRTEMRHILNTVQDLSLAYPEVKLRLISDGQMVMQSAGNGDLQQTIANIYRPAIARQLVSLQEENLEFQLKGYISPPQLTRTSRQNIHWLVNGRAIRSPMLTNVLVRAYGRKLMIGRYPLAVIHIHLDPRLVDVNVHPTKQTIRLSKEDELAALLTQAVKNVLESISPVPSVGQLLDSKDKSNVATQNDNLSQTEFDYHFPRLQEKGLVQEENPPKDSGPEGVSQESLTPSEIPDLPQTIQFKESSRTTSTVNDLSTDPFPKSSSSSALTDRQSNDIIEEESAKRAQLSTGRSHINFAGLRYVGQIHGTYLIAESEQGFYLIDQHAAQERLRYEQLMQEEADVTVQQQLLMPLVLNFDAVQQSLVEEHQAKLEKMGIYLHAFGPQSYQIESYPSWINVDELEKNIPDMLERLERQPDLTIRELQEAAIVMQSCRGAIKANQYLDQQEAIELIDSMQDLEDPYHCPHGRPVFVEFDQKTIEKLFKRIQDSHEGGNTR